MLLKTHAALRCRKMLIRALLVLVLVFGTTQTSDAFDPSQPIQPFTNCPPDTNTIVSAYLGGDNRLSAQISLSSGSTCSVQRSATGASVIQAAVIAANGKSASIDKAKCAETFNLVKQKIINYCAINDPKTCNEAIKLDPKSNEFTCGNKSSAETCESQLEPFIKQHCSSPALTSEQRKKLLKFASSAEGKLCAGGNKTAYGGERNKSFQMNGFVKDFCEKTKDLNCVVSQDASGQVSCEGGVYLGALVLNDSCTTCGIIEKMVAVTGGLGEKVYRGIQQGTIGLLSVSVALWIMLQVGKLLFPFGPLDRVSGIFNAVVTRLGITLIVGTLLLSFGSYWKYIYAPVIVSASNYAGVVLAKANGIIAGSNAEIRFGCTEETTIDPNASVATDSAKISKALTCLTREMQETIYTALAFSTKAMFAALLQGESKKADEKTTDNFLLYLADKGADAINFINVPKRIFEFIADTPEAVAGGIFGVLVALIGGGILILTWLPLYMNLPFRIADIVIRWTLLSMLSPLFIAAAVFPATRGFMVAGLRGIVQSAFELMLVAVIIALCTTAVTEVLHAAEGSTVPFLINSSLFLQLWTIAFLGNVMMGKVKSFSAAFADPDDVQGQGLDTSVAGSYADSMQKMAEGAATKGKDLATDAAATATQGKVK